MSIDRRQAQSAGIAGFAFLSCIAMVVFVCLFAHLREVGPEVREFIHWVMVPQFVMGMFAFGLLMGVGVLAMYWEEFR